MSQLIYSGIFWIKTLFSLKEFRHAVVAVIAYCCNARLYPFIWAHFLIVLGGTWLLFILRDGVYEERAADYFFSEMRAKGCYLFTWFVVTILGVLWWTLRSGARMVGGFVPLVVSVGLCYPLLRYAATSDLVQSCATYASSFAFRVQDLVQRLIANGKHRLSNCFQQPRKQSMQYNHVKTQPDQIRLLRVHSRLPFTPLYTTVITTTLANAPPFEAISYTWGTTKDTRSMFVDGKSFETSVATYNALCGRSSIWRPRIIWIDYVCINQDDLEEKAEQVKMMVDVYRLARTVIVYLDHHTRWWVTMLSISLIHEFFMFAKDNKRSAASQLYSRYELDRRTLRWAAFVEFFNHPWFDRVWVVQEVAVAERALIIYGGIAFDWTYFTSWTYIFLEPNMSALMQIDAAGQSAYRKMAHMRAIDQIRVHIEHFDTSQLLRGPTGERERKRLSLPFLLTEYAEFQATDPRDRIFAVQGMSVGVLNPKLTPNYLKSTEELYLDVAREIWSGKEPFMVIAFAGIGHQRRLALPSWAPDWTCMPDAAQLTSPVFWEELMDWSYAASGTSEALVTLMPDDANKVQVQGVIVDEISQLSCVCDLRGDDKDFFTDANGAKIHLGEWTETDAYHQEVLAMAMSDVAEQDLASRLDDFWRTLIGDITTTTRPAPPEIGFEYQIWADMLEYMRPFCLAKGKDMLVPTEEWFWSTLERTAKWGSLLGFGSVGKRFCITKTRHMGTVPGGSEVGDIIFIAAGARTPWVLRQKSAAAEQQDQDPGEYQLVGECYMRHMMDGEKMDTDRVKPIVLV